MSEVFSKNLKKSSEKKSEKSSNETDLSTTGEEPAEPGLLGSSMAMNHLRNLVRKVGASEANVLIRGENGTGKEQIANALVRHSRRRNAKFMAVNCGALAAELMESELFGHAQGAFTGAVKARKGYFELCHGGTLFLDEIGDTSPLMQVKLLRVLQEGSFLPVGAEKEVKVDVRVFAATNKNLEQLVQRGAFREDLYHRLCVIELRAPELRERMEDVPVLAEHFLKEIVKKNKLSRKVFSKEVLNHLLRHDWPGNVRELKNQVERLCVFSGTEVVITPECLSDALVLGRGAPEKVEDLSQGINPLIEAYTRKLILQAMRKHPNNYAAVARLCGYTLQGFKDLCLRVGVHLPKGHAKKLAV
jgi:two-component system, NtrC family, response regulator HupR/HoxA